MAIKVGGTEVISDSRVLSNIASVDEATVTALSDAGVGGGNKIEATASGALANGDTVVVNADGTVSVVSGNFQGLVGSATAIPNNPTNRYATDVKGDKVVLVYIGTSNYGTAVVGTISGTSITFGTAVVFWSQSVLDLDVRMYASTSFIVGWTGPYASAIRGTISGNSVTFGSQHYVQITQTESETAVGPVGYNTTGYCYRTNGNIGYYSALNPSGATGVNSTDEVQIASSSENPSDFEITEDQNESLGIVFFRGSSGWGRMQKVRYNGSKVRSLETFNQNASSGMKSVYDPTLQKVLLFYRDDSIPSAVAQFITVGNTSQDASAGPQISFPTTSANFKSAVYDSNAGKIVVFYDDKVRVVTTTANGEITFGDEAVVSVAGDIGNSAAYASSSGKIVYFYDDQSLAVETAQLFGLESSNSDSYVGVSDGGYSDGETATVQITGSVDDAQSGLTAGQKYYVLADGSLGTTPSGSTEVYAGLAVSSTELIVKG